ncbi:MAG: sterol desaturase family protein [Vicinamibacterales bacterium]
MDWQAVADDQPLLIGAMFVVMLALESARPLIDWSDGRWSHLRRNLGLTLVAFLGFGLAGMAKLAVAQWATDHRVGVLHLFALPLPLRFLASFALIDLADYVLHRAQHAVPFIWRVHRVHHADPHLDASSSLRFHPLDGVLQNAYQAVLLPILGIQLDAMIAFDTLLLVVLYFQHSNVEWPAAIDRVLRSALATPSVHRVHHSADARFTNANYGDLFTIWDRLFGTYAVVDARALRFGLDEFADDGAQTVKAMLLMPLAPVGADREGVRAAEAAASRG